MRNLQLWRSYYLRWTPEALPSESEYERLRELQQARTKLEAECRELQARLESVGTSA